MGGARRQDMASAIVYDGVHGEIDHSPVAEGLFAGQRFWLSATVPQKKRFIDDLRSNGGEVVELEKQADICLYDHAKKNPPPGMYSYQFVERSIRRGQLEELCDYKIEVLSSRAARPVGSVTLASKGSRNAFTDADDQLLWEWVKPHQGTRGEAGNVLYQQLEKANPRHTFQSWRDRWLKYVQHQKREPNPTSTHKQQACSGELGEEQPARSGGAQSAATAKIKSSSRLSIEVPMRRSPTQRRNGPVGIPHDQPKNGESRPDKPTVSSMKSIKEDAATKDDTSEVGLPIDLFGFSIEDAMMLLENAEIILSVDNDSIDNAWARLEEDYPQHTAEEWRDYFNTVVVPYHQREREMQKPGDLASEDRDLSRNPTDQAGEGGLTQSSWKDDTIAIKTEPRSSPSQAQSQDVHRSISRSQVSARPLNHRDMGRTEKISTQEPRKARRPLSNIAETHSEPSKRPKLSHHEIVVPEIPSTPEASLESSTNEGTPATPTPQARKQSLRTPIPHWSLSISPGPGDEEDDLPSIADEKVSSEKENIDPDACTSPISVHLVSDHDLPAESSSSVPDRPLQRQSTESSTPEFETAPDYKRTLGSRSVVDEDDDYDGFETATERYPLAPRQSEPKSLDLGVGSIQEDPDMALPEPVGGWDTLEPDRSLATIDPQRRSRDSQNRVTISRPASPASSTSTLDLDLDEWLSVRTAETKDYNQKHNTGQGQDRDMVDLLISSAEATNMHKRLADKVFQSLRNGDGIPRDMRGVWTSEDDEALLGTDARKVEEVSRKHGDRSLRERFECLAAWGLTG